jgi:hypothetical protein
MFHKKTTVPLYSRVFIRYIIDFLPLFLLLSCLVYFMIYDYFHEVIVGRAIVQCIAATTVLYAALANIGISIEGYGQIFKKGNPELYTAIEHFFNFIPYMINKF